MLIVKGRYDWNLLYRYFVIYIQLQDKIVKYIFFLLFVMSLSLTLSKLRSAQFNKSMSDDFFWIFFFICCCWGTKNKNLIFVYVNLFTNEPLRILNLNLKISNQILNTYLPIFIREFLNKFLRCGFGIFYDFFLFWKLYAVLIFD